MSVTTEAGTRPVNAGGVAMPHDLREVMEVHLVGFAGLPTPEIVEIICREVAPLSHKEKVLKYFLVQSPLRPVDLGRLLCGTIGQDRAHQICFEAARIRMKREMEGKKPRWEEAQTS